MTDDPHRDPTPAEEAECRRALEEFTPNTKTTRVSVMWTDASLLRHAEDILAHAVDHVTNNQTQMAYALLAGLRAEIVAHHDAYNDAQERIGCRVCGAPLWLNGACPSCPSETA